MTPQALASTFFFILALAGLGVVCSGWRAYGRDSFRQRAFTIRDRLFSYAADGHIDFNDPAYWRLRHAMNSTIRFSHKLTFGESVLPLFVRVLCGYKSDTEWWDRWEEAVSKQPPDVQQSLQKIHKEFGTLFAGHMFKYTPLAWPLIVATFLMANWSDIEAKVAVSLAEEAMEEADPEWLAQQGIAAA